MINNRYYELLAPAGNLQKAKIAIDFGADAIYLGGFNYSLRARASNFGINEIREISKYCHQRKKRWYIVINVVCQNAMIKNFLGYLKTVLKYKPDACIASDPFIITQIRKINKTIPIHISTQQSITNSKSCLFFKRNGANRAILAREVSCKEMALMEKALKGQFELETFIHGAVCIGYSGRCVLSNNFCLRDSNIGGCAQSCRWIYKLYDDNKTFSNKFSMSAKDMALAKYMPQLMKIKLNSFKIEGRMKSEYYIATVVSNYRRIIDNIKTNIKPFVNDVKSCANRECDYAWFNGKPNSNAMLYHDEEKKVKQNYLFDIIKIINNKTYKVMVKNKILLKDKISFVTQNTKLFSPSTIINKIIDKNGQNVDTINSPMTEAIIEIKNGIDLKVGDMARRDN